MTTTDRDKFACPSCGRSYSLKPELSGRKVKCKCGHVMLAPEMPADDGIGEGYELAIDEDLPNENLAAPAVDGRCPQCNMAIQRGAVICMNCGLDLRQGAPVQTRVTDEPLPPVQQQGLPQTASLHAARSRLDRDQLAEQEAAQSRRREVIYPVVIAALGVTLTGVNAFVLAPMAFDPLQASGGAVGLVAAVAMLIYAGLRFAFQAPMMLFGLFFCAKIFGTGYGNLLTALLKLAAIVLFVGAVSDLLDFTMLLTIGVSIFFVKVGITIIVFDALAMWMFEMEYLESSVLWLITYLGPVLLAVALYTSIM